MAISEPTNCLSQGGMIPAPPKNKKLDRFNNTMSQAMIVEDKLRDLLADIIQEDVAVREAFSPFVSMADMLEHHPDKLSGVCDNCLNLIDEIRARILE